MKIHTALLVVSVGCVLLVGSSCQEQALPSATVPMILDHNRMLVDAEIQRNDGTWRPARLWIDTGNPDFFVSEALARDLGIDLAGMAQTPAGQVRPMEIPPPAGLRLGGMPLKLEGVRSLVMFEPRWLFDTMHNDANLPSTVLKQYHVIFDYPQRQVTIAQPGHSRPQGVRSPARVHPATGIVQIDALIDKDSLSFALDNGASYSFTSEAVLARLADQHPSWPRTTGAVGCANIWGWWPGEAIWPIVRVAEIQWGSARLLDVGLAGLPNFFPNGSDLGTWYSQKTATPVDGFLGPNAFKAFRVEIDYADGAVYFEKGGEYDSGDMDLVGLTLRPQGDGSYQVIGVGQMDGGPAVSGVEVGDVLLEVDNLKITGATMGSAVDALRGKPGDVHTLVLDRGGTRVSIQAKVEHLL